MNWQRVAKNPLDDSLGLAVASRSRDYLVEARIAGRQAASRYLKALVSIGVLREQTFGKEKLSFHPKLMTLLTRDSSTFGLPMSPDECHNLAPVPSFIPFGVPP
jgi:hypothetical protein